MITFRLRGLARAAGGAVAASLAAIGVAAQGGPVMKSEACPDVKNYAAFHKCALDRMRTFTPPRTPDGRPDLRGIWQPSGIAFDIEEFSPTQYGPLGAPANVPGGKSLIVDPADGKIPYQPWAAVVRQNARHVYISPVSACFQVGPQRFFLLGPVHVIAQPRSIHFATERYNGHRIVHMDGRAALGKDIALWNGSSRGRWDGDTLVIETSNLNGLTWFDQTGNFLSSEARLVERITYVDANTLHYQETITDPNVFTRPWTIAQAMQRSAATAVDTEIWYEDLVENCHLSLQNQFNQGKQWWPGIPVIAPWVIPGIQEPRP